MQCNEGHWSFSLQDSNDGSHILLDVAVGKFLDSSLILADVQPHVARLLIKVCSQRQETPIQAYWLLVLSITP